MAEKEVIVSCYWNACTQIAPDGVSPKRLHQGWPKDIRLKRNSTFTTLLDQLYLLTGLDKQRSKFSIIGIHPSVSRKSKVGNTPHPVVDDASLKTLLDYAFSCRAPYVQSMELYLELKTTSADVIHQPATCSLPLENASSSSKRQRINHTNVTPSPVKLETDGGLTNGISGSDRMPDNVIVLSGDSSTTHKQLSQDSGSGVSKPCMSSLWLDDHDFRVGLCFKDSDELEKAVDWCSFKGQRKCVVQETAKDKYIFKCVRYHCRWSLMAGKLEKHGLVEITKYTGPHTCSPIDPEVFRSEYEADQIERVVRIHPMVSTAELKKWWKEKVGYKLAASEVRYAKEKAIKRVFGDWDQSFEDFPKLMAALCSSNGLLVDWKYDLCPNPKFASFSGVFWAFSQSIEGFQHCRPLLVVDTTNLGGEYELKLMIASGVDAANKYFPLAFAVTKEVSVDSWCWFLSEIREKFTQRKGICLISSPHPDILTVVNESGSQWKEPWAYHRFCLSHLCSQFRGVFRNDHLEDLVELAGSTSKKEEFDTCLKNIRKDNPEARKWLDQFPPHKWALVHDTGLRYGFMKIDTEALFACCRGFQLPDHVVTGSVLLLFDELRDSFNESFSCSRASLNCGDKYTEPVMEKLVEYRTSSVTYIVIPLDNSAFQVTTPSQKDEWIVHLNDLSCTCGEFQSCNIPCKHALAVCKKMKINPLKYVDDCYSLKRLNKTYAAKFSHVPEISTWPEASGVPRLFPPVILQPSPPPPPPNNVPGNSKRKITKTKRFDS